MTNHEGLAASETDRLQGRGTEYRYHLLAAGKPGLTALDQHQLKEIPRKADKTPELESLVPDSPAAAEIVIPSSLEEGDDAFQCHAGLANANHSLCVLRQRGSFSFKGE